MEKAIFAIFCMLLLACVLTGRSVVLALFLGLLLFLGYGRAKGFSCRQLLGMCREGVGTSLNVMITMLVIGALTALWRASGCIPTIVCYASSLISPSAFVLLTFLLNSLISTLTGTAFGTAATMGVICASIGASMNIPAFLTGGAILGGAFLGDRCSPVSTSALLVSTVTGTDIYVNIRNMLKSALLPFLITCALYLAAGFAVKGGGASMDVRSLFESEFRISAVCLAPAAVMLLLAFFRVEVKAMMLLSIAVSVPVAVYIQGQSVPEILKTIAVGYTARSGEISGMINGGGVVSMISVSAVVLIASCYSGIFKKTGMLDFMREAIEKASSKVSGFLVVLATSVAVTFICCNQTLAIMLTEQLTSDIEKDNEKRALWLADSAVVVSPLVPWSIGCSVPLTTVGAPVMSVLAASYLYVLPAVTAVRNRRRKQTQSGV